MLRRRLEVFGLMALLAGQPGGVMRATPAAARGVDASLPAIEAARLWAAESTDVRIVPGTWLRLRETGLQFLGPAEEGWAVVNAGRHAETMAALQQLRARGFRLLAVIELSQHDWPRGVHKTGGVKRAEDLRDVAAYGRAIREAYGDLVDAWEVENEPDLGFVSALPENYAAYLKAFWLGFKAGDTGSTAGTGQPLVLMGALGLPPGPWLERFAANDGFGYTDGFSYHYYGYAEDFTAVYRQHEAAVAGLSRQNLPNDPGGSAHSVQKALPVFMTEAGYGLLGVEESNTSEGRLRQWRWFRQVGMRARELRLAAVNAFVLKPYPAYGAMEMGLTVPAAKAAASNKGQVASGNWVAGGIEYRPEDFGAKSTEPWMEKIGKPIGGNETTPALAWWLSSGSGSGEHGDGNTKWTISVPVASPVVVDFLPGPGLQPVKRFNGSFVTGVEPVAPPPAPIRGKGPGEFKQAPGGEFMLQLRTWNGNLYEVYPTRLASGNWQNYLEHRDNFTMSFYSRAALPWRLAGERPVSLGLVLYPRSLPAVYEFRHVRLVRLELKEGEPSLRHGRGQVAVYNFSDRAVKGRLELPAEMTAEGVAGRSVGLSLEPGARHLVDVTVQVPAGPFSRSSAVIRFWPEPGGLAPAVLETVLLPDIGKIKPVTAADLLAQADTRSNRLLVANRPRATDEAPISGQAAGSKEPGVGLDNQPFAFAQQGATVGKTGDGFTVTVTGAPLGAGQRVEVAIPWPDGLEFRSDEFLSLEFRMRTAGGER